MQLTSIVHKQTSKRHETNNTNKKKCLKHKNIPSHYLYKSNK